MTATDILLVIAFAPFALAFGLLFMVFAMAAIGTVFQLAWLLGDVLWQASSQAANDVWNWRKK